VLGSTVRQFIAAKNKQARGSRVIDQIGTDDTGYQPSTHAASKRKTEASTPSISLVLPMFNESESVDWTLQEATGSLERHFADFEIIVVDDGSTDDCAVRVEGWAERDPRIVLIRMQRNQRLGVALRKGLRAATKELVFYTDFDLPVALDFLPHLVNELARTDIITGYSAELAKNLDWGAKLLSRGYNRLVHALFGLPLRDVNFGLKAMRKSLCSQFHLISRSPFVNAEIFIQARQRGYRVSEVAVPFLRRQHGVSRIRRVDVIWWTLLDMARVWMKPHASANAKSLAEPSQRHMENWEEPASRRGPHSADQC
jgi:glycosyltransferase involved in cell wall biosynthesis